MTRPPMADASNSEGWIEWAGGKCPLKDGQFAEVYLRMDLLSSEPSLTKGNSLRWSHRGWPGDVVRYRIVGDDQ